MSWRDLLAPDGGEQRVLPWTGGDEVHSPQQSWNIRGKRPPEFGWYNWEVKGRKARMLSQADVDPAFEEKRTLRGYLIGDRFIADSAFIVLDVNKLIDQTESVYCVEQGLERFSRAVVFRSRNGKLVFLRQEWPTGPEEEVNAAYQDRKLAVTNIPGVTPQLDLAFRFCTWQREVAEERAREAERLRLEEEARLEAEEKLRLALKDAGTGAGRRALAQKDFAAAARAALAISGAELLDHRELPRGEVVVQYRFRNRRLECVCDKLTLRIIDAGVCLDNHRGTKGDTYFTLESLPPVIGEALDIGRLVVWRHVAGDPGGRGNQDWDDDNDRRDEDDDW